MSQDKPEITKYHFNKRETAEIMGVKTMTLDTWGIYPDIRDGRQAFFDIRKVIEYKFKSSGNQVADLSKERARLAKLQADKVDIELKILNGEAVKIQDVEAHWSKMLMAMRAKILSIPSRIAPVALEAKGLAAIEERATELVEEALEEINDNGIPKGAGKSKQKDAGADASAAKADNKRVGRSGKTTKPRGKRRARAVAD